MMSSSLLLIRTFIRRLRSNSGSYNAVGFRFIQFLLLSLLFNAPQTFDCISYADELLQCDDDEADKRTTALSISNSSTIIITVITIINTTIIIIIIIPVRTYTR
jgi:hypothetical protein